MNKSELVKVFSEKFEIGDVAGAEIVNLFFDAIRQQLTNGERVEIRGFGAFSVREHGGYTGRNPKSGKLVDVPPKRLPFFRASKELKAYLNQEK